jgi:hypothetical protein
MLFEQFEPRFTYPNDEDIKANGGFYPGISQLMALPEKELESIRLLFGHFPFGVARILPYKVTCGVILRDPIERSVSNLLAMKAADSDIENKSYMDILELHRSQFDNSQTRFFTGPGDNQIRGDADLELARRNLRSCQFVGITEYFRDSVRVAEKMFGWELGKPLWLNKAKTGPGVPEDVLQKLRQINRLDMEIYADALEIFNGLRERYL